METTNAREAEAWDQQFVAGVVGGFAGAGSGRMNADEVFVAPQLEDEAQASSKFLGHGLASERGRGCCSTQLPNANKALQWPSWSAPHHRNPSARQPTTIRASNTTRMELR